MNKKSSELNVITKAKDLSEYVFTITHKSPKEFRFTIVVKMQNYCMGVILPKQQEQIAERIVVCQGGYYI